MSDQPIYCTGPGPHTPADGVLGTADRQVAGMLCVLCAAMPQVASVPDPTPAAQLDPVGVAKAITDAQATPTLATLQAAILALGGSITPLSP